MQIKERFCVENWSYYTGCCPDGVPVYECIFNEIMTVITIPNYLGGWLSLSYMSLTLGMAYVALESYNMSEFQKKHDSIEISLGYKITYYSFLFIGIFGFLFGLYGGIKGFWTMGSINMFIGIMYMLGYYDIISKIREMSG